MLHLLVELLNTIMPVLHLMGSYFHSWNNVMCFWLKKTQTYVSNLIYLNFLDKFARVTF